MSSNALCGVLAEMEQRASRAFISTCRNFGLTISSEIAGYIVGIFIATVAEEQLDSETSWASAALEAVKDSEVTDDDQDLDEIAGDFSRALYASCLERAKTWQKPLEAGDSCRAVLAEDGQWHDATVVEVLHDDLTNCLQYKVEIVEYGKHQLVGCDQVTSAVDTLDKDGDVGVGSCELCKREMPLTRHHLIPRKTHSKLKKRGAELKDLLKSAYICRPCHNAVHKAEDEMTLATKYSTVDRLLAHPKISKSVEYYKTQAVRLK